MVSREDLRKINETSQDLQDALDEMKELYEQENNEGVTVDDVAFEDAQARVKDAVSKLVNDADDMVDRTDVYEPDEESASAKTLPQAALERTNTKDLPNPPEETE